MAGYGEAWATLDGHEIWNSARTASYLHNGLAPPGVDVGSCVACDGIGVAVEDDDWVRYILPELDEAPWYDPDVPESADFAGLLVTEITGLDDSPFTRTMATTLNGGGSFGRLAVNARTVMVRGLLLGRTCCAIAYGQRWLTRALIAEVDGCSCDQGAFCFLTCCPETTTATDTVCEPHLPRPPRPPEWTNYGRFFRTTCNAGMLEGPKVTDRLGTGCGCGGCVALQVEFTIGMGAFLFGEPVPCITDMPFDPDTAYCALEILEECCEPLELYGCETETVAICVVNEGIITDQGPFPSGPGAVGMAVTLWRRDDNDLIFVPSGATLGYVTGWLPGETYTAEVNAWGSLGLQLQLTDQADVEVVISPESEHNATLTFTPTAATDRLRVWADSVLEPGTLLITTEAEIELPTDEQAGCPECGGEIIWVPNLGVAKCAGACGDDPDDTCVIDPRCPLPPPPPVPPLPDTACGEECDPLNVRQLCCNVAADEIGDWSDAVVAIEIYSGTGTPLRNLKVLAFPNPLGFDPSVFDECDACAGFMVTYVPCDATMRIDGACRTVTVQCQGSSELNADRFVRAVDGAPFRHIVLDCTDWTICVYADDDNIADDATVSISIIPRSA